MSDLKSTVPFVSLTTPGVTGVVRKLTFGARNALRKRLASVYDRKLDLGADMAELVEELQTAHPDSKDLMLADLTARETVRFEKLSSAIQIVENDINAAQIEECFISLDATIDGAPVTKANLAELPVDLARELVQAILGATGATGDAAKNSGSATTSGGVDGRETNSSTAASAAGTGTIAPANAANSPS